MVLVTDVYCVQFNSALIQVEVIQLENDDSGLGFGIIGTKGMGVIIKTIIAGGVSARVSNALLSVAPAQFKSEAQLCDLCKNVRFNVHQV